MSFLYSITNITCYFCIQLHFLHVYFVINMPDVRADIGALWENYLMSERMKYTQYNDIFLNRYFWRSRTKQEIDYIEEREGKLFAFEFKWNPKAKYRFPKIFLENYPENEVRIVNSENYYGFLGTS